MHTKAPLVTVREIAERVGVTLPTVRRWIETGQVGAVRQGKRWLVATQPYPGTASIPEIKIAAAFPMAPCAECTRNAGKIAPPHTASRFCRSGAEDHCSCAVCF